MSSLWRGWSTPFSQQCKQCKWLFKFDETHQDLLVNRNSYAQLKPAYVSAGTHLIESLRDVCSRCSTLVNDYKRRTCVKLTISESDDDLSNEQLPKTKDQLLPFNKTLTIQNLYADMLTSFHSILFLTRHFECQLSFFQFVQSWTRQFQSQLSHSQS